MTTKSEIMFEIKQITAKLRNIAAFDLWDCYDVQYLENRLETLRAKLEEFEI